MAEKDKRYKLDGVDEYGRPKYKISNFDAYMKDPRTGISGGYLAPLDLPFSLFGERKIKNAPPTKKEMTSINKRKSDLQAERARLKQFLKTNALSNAAEKAKPAKPTSPPPRSKNPAPKPPVTKAPPKPGKPDYNTKNVPMPNKTKTKKYPSRGM